MSKKLTFFETHNYIVLGTKHNSGGWGKRACFMFCSYGYNGHNAHVPYKMTWLTETLR